MTANKVKLSLRCSLPTIVTIRGKDGIQMELQKDIIEIASNKNSGIPVIRLNTFQRAICTALLDEPQDVLFVADQLRKSEKRKYWNSTDGAPGNEILSQKVTRELEFLIGFGIVDSRYNLFLLTIKGREFFTDHCMRSQASRIQGEIKWEHSMA
jgi:hypothetical protein